MQKKTHLKKRLPKLGIDGILITDISNVRYLSGFTGSAGFIILTGKYSIFVTDSRYEEQAKDEVSGFTLKTETRDRTSFIKELTEQLGINKLGFEDHSLSYLNHKKLLGRKIRLKPVTNAVEEFRLIKSDEELFHIRKAVQRAEKAFRKLKPFIRVGVTEQKLAAKLESLLKDEGCKKIPFEVIVASGRRSAFPHAKPSSRVIKKGDLILFDWGGESGGYYSDMTRMIAIKGRLSEKQMQLHSIVLNALKRAVEAVRPGVRTGVVDSAARGFIKQNGFGDHFGHGTGHGIGLAVHERPFISWNRRDVIKENMVFSIEPGIYVPGVGGVRLEDIVVVRKNRAEVLTTLPRSLQIIGN
ncbi:MAG TPA: aminopeptidase P family protein [Nitrospirae bacterium]|nr:aminopeptidase P family protein [Nitrospirota bacterium]